MGKYVSEETKQAVLEDIKNGLKVSEAAVKHGVVDKSIYRWMRLQADNTGTSSLEVAKLRRENQELKEIIGLFALEKKRAEKNRQGA
jgi:transposase-like protein